MTLPFGLRLHHILLSDIKLWEQIIQILDLDPVKGRSVDGADLIFGPTCTKYKPNPSNNKSF